MVKKRAVAAQKRTKPKTVVKRRERASGLDSAALDYARLLIDPCNGKLVHPIYPGADAGFLFRAESFGTIATGASITAGTLHWTPGYVNSSGTEVLATQNLDGGAAVAAGPLTSLSPGRTFLLNNAKAVRCIAACLKITFPGSESARSGRVHYGITSAGIIDNTNSIVPDGVAQSLQNYTRTPPETIELVWRPTIADTEFNDPTEAASAVIRDRKSALTVAFAGLPASVGMTFHFTALYEWTPAVNIGVAHNSSGKAESRNSLDDVLDAVKRTGFSYVRQLGAHAASGAISALMSGSYGLMGARPNTRNVRQLTQ